MTKILFLYSELAAYTVNCLNKAVELNPKLEIHVIRWAVNKEAPFEFDFFGKIYVVDKTEISIEEYFFQCNPEVIVCSGWFDADYIKLVKKVKSKVKTVLMFDNYWENTIKQKIGCIVLPFTITKQFDFCWVPGEIQKEYAKKIRFKEEQIKLGFYATDLEPFETAYQNTILSKNRSFPRKFLYVGRYLELKGIKDLWEAFASFSVNNPEWELHCVGAGELYENRITHDRVFHHGFIQPSELTKLISKTGVFIMPSHYDHWGMAVQEFAASGFPLICSDKVGANCAFLQENKNGFTFKAKSVSSLIQAMNKISNLNLEQLCSFGQKSNELSKLYDSTIWSNTLTKILKK